MILEFLIWLAYLMAGASLVFHFKEKHGWALFFLLLAGLSIYFSAVGWVPYLNVWDERFHALVAKNLMAHPLKPTLYDERVVSMPYNFWDKYHIWLHKQPGFLWQIMLSYFLFGVNEFALRFPSILAFTALLAATYRSGAILVNRRVGYFAAFLFASSLYFAELVAGYAQLDHHDVMSITYCSLSIWAFLEYLRKPKGYWLILIGAFAGMAILNKWLVGLLVFLVWGLYNVQLYKLNLRKYGAMALALLVTLGVALPWQIIAAWWYPAESAEASKYFAEHFTVAMAAHESDFWYHLNLLGEHYGMLAHLFVAWGLYKMRRLLENRALYLALMGAIAFVYLFFGIAQTKMPSFTLVISLPIFIALGCMLFDIENFLSQKFKGSKPYAIVFPAALLLLFFIRLNIFTIKDKHPAFTVSGICQERMLYNKELFTGLNLPENAVLFNLKGRHYIEAMFYTPAIAYNFIPSESQLQEALDKDKAIYVFPGPEPLPDYLSKNAEVIVLNMEPQVCE